MIDRTYRLAEVQDAFRRFPGTGDHQGKVVVRMV